MKKHRKRVLSLLIVLAMLLGIFPTQKLEVSASGSQAPRVSILTFSDYQRWLWPDGVDDWATLQPQLTGLVNGAYDAGVRPDYMIFGGDFSCLDSTSTS